MAGPWFAVRESGSDWAPFGRVWMSDGGGSDEAGTLEMKVVLRPADPGALGLAAL